MIQGSLLNGSTLPKPSAVQAVVLATCLFFMVNELGHRAQQAPSRVFGCMHLCTSAVAFIEHLHFLKCSLIGQADGQVRVAVRIADHLQEVVVASRTIA